MQRTGWIRSAGLSLGVAAVMTLIASCAAQPTDSADIETDARAPFGLSALSAIGVVRIVVGAAEL